MTMSVGLGRIINDPSASILIRKALGVLSTPGLLVTDQGITINDDGRFTLKLTPNGGLSEDSTGLSVSGVITVDGIVGGVAAGSGIWNVYLTGTAANHFAGSVAIGTTTLTAKLGVQSTTEQLRLIYDALNYVTITVGVTGLTTIEPVGTAAGISVTGAVSVGTTTLTATLGVLSTTEQLRLQYDASNYCKTTVGSTGLTTIAAVGTNASIDLVTPAGEGVTINGGAPILKVLTGIVNKTFSLDGTMQYYSFALTGAALGDAAFVSPEFSPSAGITGWSASVFNTNSVQIRVTTDNLGGTYNTDWRVTVIRF